MNNSSEMMCEHKKDDFVLEPIKQKLKVKSSFCYLHF